MKTDYGSDPLGNGQWKLVPSGQIVDKAGLEQWKKERQLPAREPNECLGLSWNQIEAMQGGKLKR